MPRDDPVDAPSPAAAGRAAATALGRPVASVTEVEEGLNAVYAITFGDGERAILKVATVVTDEELLPEPRVLQLVAEETAVSVPEVLATIPAEAGPLPVAAFLQAYCEGRGLADLLELPQAARERLLAEAGRNLGRIHDLAVGDRYGDLRVVEGDLAVPEGPSDWGERFATVADEVLGYLAGERSAYHVGASRFADLVPAGRAAFEDGLADGPLADADPPVALVHGDYRPANLVLAPDDADPLTRWVIDFGDPLTGDPLLDLAFTEDAMVDVPLGGTEDGDRLRQRLRGAYADEYGVDPGEDRRYPYYRLFARYTRLSSFDYWQGFAREDGPDAVADRMRAFVDDRLAEIG